MSLTKVSRANLKLLTNTNDPILEQCNAKTEALLHKVKEFEVTFKAWED